MQKLGLLRLDRSRGLCEAGVRWNIATTLQA